MKHDQMIPEFVRHVIVRDLDSMRTQIEAYAEEAQIWQLVPGISNSAGTLALHVAGNLQHYVGAVLGGSKYVRDRPAEFSRRNVPRAELLSGLDDAAAAVESSLGQLPASRLAEVFPEPIGNVRVMTGDFLIHLTSHLAFHLGQVDYHRRMSTGQSAIAGNQALTALRSAGPAD